MLCKKTILINDSFYHHLFCVQHIWQRNNYFSGLILCCTLVPACQLVPIFSVEVGKFMTGGFIGFVPGTTTVLNYILFIPCDVSTCLILQLSKYTCMVIGFFRVFCHFHSPFWLLLLVYKWRYLQYFLCITCPFP